MPQKLLFTVSHGSRLSLLFPCALKLSISKRINTFLPVYHLADLLKTKRKSKVLTARTNLKISLCNFTVWKFSFTANYVNIFNAYLSLTKIKDMMASNNTSNNNYI